MSILAGDIIDRDTLNRAYVSKAATGTQIMAGSLRLLGGIQIDGATTIGSVTTGALTLTGALNAGANSITTTGTITAGTFSGSGASLTSLNGSNISSGTVADARLSSNVFLLNTAQTVTANTTLSSAANLYFAGGTSYKIDTVGSAWFNALNVAGNATFDGNDYIEFSQAGVAPPSNTSAGTKIKLFNDGYYSLGIDTATIWFDTHTNHKFYTNSGGSTRVEQVRINTSGLSVYNDTTITGNLEVQGEIKSAGANEFPDPLLIAPVLSKWVATRGTVAIDNVQVPSGTYASNSIKLTATSADSYYHYDYFFPVNPNEWVAFSAYTFSTTAGNTGDLFIRWYDSTKTMIATPAPATTFNAPTSWGRFNVSGQAPATAAYFQVRVDNNNSGAVMYYAAFQVERGRAMTGFKPYSGGQIATFFDKGIKLASDGEIHSGYNNNYIIKDHGNGNVTLSAAGGNLYLGYQNTTNVFLSRPLTNNSSLNIINTDGTLFYKGTDINTIYLRKDGGTMSGDITIAKDNAWLTLDSNGSGANGVEQAAGISIGESGYKGAATLHLTYTGDGYGHIGMGTVDATTSLPQYEAMRLYYMDNTVRFYAAPTVNGSTMWHAGNDGAGSGLDADTVDGLQASSFMRSDANTSTTGTLSINGSTLATNSGVLTFTTTGGVDLVGRVSATSFKVSSSFTDLVNNAPWYGLGYNNVVNGTGYWTQLAGYFGLWLKTSGNDIKINQAANDVTINGNRIVTVADYGTGKNLDADKVDGKHSSDLMSSTVYREKIVVPVGGYATGTSITIPNSRVYVLGSNRLQVFRDGILQEPVDDYVEATTSTVKFQYNLPEDTRITFIITNAG
jgi:hypothetical protein